MEITLKNMDSLACTDPANFIKLAAEHSNLDGFISSVQIAPLQTALALLIHSPTDQIQSNVRILHDKLWKWHDSLPQRSNNDALYAVITTVAKASVMMHERRTQQDPKYSLAYFEASVKNLVSSLFHRPARTRQ